MLAFAGGSFAQKLQFDIASVKPAAPGQQVGSMNGGPLPIGPFNQTIHEPGRILWQNVWIERVIQVAYDFPINHIAAPAWMEHAKYDITATFPAATSVDGFRKMLQNLLAERFQLSVHKESRDEQGYAVEVMKTGVKLKPSRADVVRVAPTSDAVAASAGNALMIVDADGYPAPRPDNPIYAPDAPFEATIRSNGMFRATVRNEDLAAIAKFLGNILGQPVKDETGLAGKYDFHLEYLPRGNGAQDSTPDIPAPRPDLLDAVPQQLGLRLVRAKLPVETLVIDRMERTPTDN